MKKNIFPSVYTSILALLSLIGAFGCVPANPGGNAVDGYNLTGFVGHSSTVPATGTPVALLDGTTGRTIATTQTDGVFGKYAFANLPPGTYRISAGKVARDVVISNQGVRLDIDLSALGGEMNYAKEGLNKMMNSGGKMPVPAGPSDPALVQMIAGKWYSYSGGGYGSMGGTERRLTLCPSGVFFKNSESSYSGGAGTAGAWGATGSGGGDGAWSIMGNPQQATLTISYRGGRAESMTVIACGDGCVTINGVKYGYDGQANCQ